CGLGNGSDCRRLPSRGRRGLIWATDNVTQEGRLSSYGGIVGGLSGGNSLGLRAFPIVRFPGGGLGSIEAGDRGGDRGNRQPWVRGGLRGGFPCDVPAASRCGTHGNTKIFRRSQSVRKVLCRDDDAPVALVLHQVPDGPAAGRGEEAELPVAWPWRPGHSRLK